MKGRSYGWPAVARRAVADGTASSEMTTPPRPITAGGSPPGDSGSVEGPDLAAPTHSLVAVAAVPSGGWGSGAPEEVAAASGGGG